MEGALRKEDLGLGDLEEEPLDVLDLPQIYTRPSAKTLLDTLSLLSVESRSWEVTPSQTPGSLTPRTASGASTPLRPPKRKVRSEGVSQYLTKIISSRLAWIDSEDDKERIWDTASVRMSERAGRTAMGSFTRTFPVPLLQSQTEKASQESEEDTISPSHVDISIHEPALTADNLGFKTWAASYVLASRWNILLEKAPALRQCCEPGNDMLLELGAGTGLVGLAAAAILGARVILTDLPAITANLVRNLKDNADAIHTAGGQGIAAALDWEVPEDVLFSDPSMTPCGNKELSCLDAPVIVAADPVYSAHHPRMLVQAIKQHLRKTSGATVILGVAIREADTGARGDLRARLASMGLELVYDDEAVGLDDWSEGKGEEACEVACSLMVWRRP